MRVEVGQVEGQVEGMGSGRVGVGKGQGRCGGGAGCGYKEGQGEDTGKGRAKVMASDSPGGTKADRAETTSTCPAKGQGCDSVTV